jgi:hypothetical protein
MRFESDWGRLGLNFNFNLEDSVNVLKELIGIIYNAAQDRMFAMENLDALRSKNALVISNRLYMTNERYKIAIKILTVIVNIAEGIASPPMRREKSFRLSECVYCYRYNQQESIECKECHRLTYLTDMIPVYTVMQKAGEKGIDWGVDWFIKQIVNAEDGVEVKDRFYEVWNQQN